MKTIDKTWIVLNITTTSVLEVFLCQYLQKLTEKILFCEILILWMEAEVVQFSPPPGGARKERPLTLQEPCVCASARSDNIKATFRARKKNCKSWHEGVARQPLRCAWGSADEEFSMIWGPAEPSRAEPRALSAFVLCVIWLLIVGFSVSLSLSNEANSNPVPRERKRLNCRDSDAFDLEREQPPGTFL